MRPTVKILKTLKHEFGVWGSMEQKTGLRRYRLGEHLEAPINGGSMNIKHARHLTHQFPFV